MSEPIDTSVEAAENAVLMCRHEAHTNKDASKAGDLPVNVIDKPIQSKSPAAWAYERLVLYIQTFEESLDSEHEVAMGFAGGDAGVLRIEGMGYFDPDIVTFYGTDTNGAKTQLIQHVTQLAVMLRAMPKGRHRRHPGASVFSCGPIWKTPKPTQPEQVTGLAESAIQTCDDDFFLRVQRHG
jgi:hypothetical protein